MEKVVKGVRPDTSPAEQVALGTAKPAERRPGDDGRIKYVPRILAAGPHHQGVPCR